MTPEQRVELAERRAMLARSRLFRAIDALDVRRYEVERKIVAVGHEARHVVTIGFWTMLGFACVAVVGVAVLAWRGRR